MNNNIELDDTIIDKVIFGRIEPKIYAFKTKTIPNYLKVGDTFRSVEERLNEWRNNGFVDLIQEGQWSAEISGEKIYFRDYSVHNYLVNKGKSRLNRNLYPDKPYSKEFFEKATKKDVDNAIKDIVQSYYNNSSKYTYYEVENRVVSEKEYIRDDYDWEPRNPLQTNAIANFKKALNNKRDNLLMYAIMRFGKSFTSLCCAKEMGAKFVLVVSGKADVADEWQQTVQKPGQFKDFVFLNSKKLKRNDTAISEAQKNGKSIVLFLTFQDLAIEKKRFDELFSSEIDLMIIDETHFGARAENWGQVVQDAHYKEDTALKEIEKIDGMDKDSLGSIDRIKAEKKLEKEIKGLNVKVKLHLSGTPYRILMGDEFEKQDIISFCQYPDIIREKEKWDKENIVDEKSDKTNKEEWDNPYYGFPHMIRFAFNLNESSIKKIEKWESEGYSYHLSNLFSPKSIEKDENKDYQKFVNESEVIDFLKAIDGSKKDKNILGFLDNKRIKEGKLCRHIVMVLPYCASCDAMEKIITDRKKSFKKLSEYELINISGIDSKYKKIQEVKSKISKCEKDNKKTITLTVNRMLTGCTVPEWDTMIYLKDTASPQDYDQAIFRLQSQYVIQYKGNEEINGKQIERVIKRDMKPQTLLVDFNPQRMFYLQEVKSRINNINTADGGNDESEIRIKKDLEISPIIHVKENKLVEVTPIDILKAVSEYSTNRGITEAANDIIVDEKLIQIEDIRKIIDKEYEIDSGKGLTTHAYQDADTNLDDEDIIKSDYYDENITENISELHESECYIVNNNDEIKTFVKKCRSYYRRLLFYAFLCKSDKEVKNIIELLESIDLSENKRIFKNLGMNKEFICLMNNKMNGIAKRSLDDKIYDLYRLSHEYENEDIDPIKRATTAIKKFGKISDSEVVTPQNIAKKIVDCIPEKDFINVFNNKNKFLDIASKMGEFAVAIYNRAVKLDIPKDKIKDSIYSIPTSNLAYEFTRFVYEKLDLNIENIAENFNSYQLLEINKTKKREKTKLIDYEYICSCLTQDISFNKININEIKKGDKKVKFDVVIGNPPYQKNQDKTSDNPIYNDFMEIGYAISPMCCFITPAKFLFNAGKTPKIWNTKMLNDEHLKIEKYYSDSKEVFEDVGFEGGLAISIRNSKQMFEPIGEFVPYNELKQIINKVKKKRFESIDSIIYSPESYKFSNELHKENPEIINILSKGHKYDIVTDIFDKLPRIFNDDNNQSYKFYGLLKKKRTTKYIKQNYISNHENINKYKVLVPKANGSSSLSATSKTDVIGETILSKPLEGHTQSFISIGKFDTLYEAKALQKYIKTKFVRVLIASKKVTQDNKKSVWINVPRQDFTKKSDIDWSQSIPEIDNCLYKKYSFTLKEIDFIESKINPMD